MLIDAQDAGTSSAAPLGQLAPQEVVKPALDSGSADAFPFPQTAPVDAVVMRHEHAPAERFGRPFPRQNPRKALPEATAAISAAEFARLQFHNAMP